MQLECVASEVCRDCGALRNCTVHCVCSWKVREERRSFDKAVIPLQL